MRTLLTALWFSSIAVTSLTAQSWPTDDAVLRRIWQVGMDDSRAERIAQPLMDSIGPRLTGTPEMLRANEWAVQLMEGWGIEARNEEYGTWMAWSRGPTHIDLIAPRVRTLEGTLLAWSAGTAGPIEGDVVTIPDFQTTAQFEAWLTGVRGKFVALSFPQPTCRPDRQFEEFGTPGALERMQTERAAAGIPFDARERVLPLIRSGLEAAGAAGILQSEWAGEMGVNRIYYANLARTPVVDLSCEDYGLLWRLAANGQGPRLRLNAEAESMGEQPVYNTIGMIRGRELPDEYVVLSAHFDSWDGASGATDNGAGVTVMLEAMRILATAYPNPRRTILLGLWSGEEQGLNGSRRFVGMHPEVVDGLQALFNHDEGTGRVFNISSQGMLDAGAHLTRWMAQVPTEISAGITLDVPGLPSAGSSDHAAFICAGVPAINFKSVSWNYPEQTWHSNRDSYDKLVFEEIRSDAVLTAMLAYLAADDPQRVGPTRRELPAGADGQPQPWPTCAAGAAATN